MPLKRAFFCALTFLFISTAHAQDQETWKNLENDIGKKKELAGTELRLQGILREAWREKRYIQYARALDDLVRIKDLRTEDTLFFRNSAGIDSLLENAATPGELIPLLHLMQARRLSAFLRHRLRFNLEQYLINGGKLSGKDLDSAALLHFAEAGKAIPPSLKTASATELYWLCSNPLDLLFRPAYVDILYMEKVNHLQQRHRWLAMNNEDARKWMQYSPEKFINVLDSLRTEPGNVFAAFGEWLAETPARRYIEMLARQTLMDHFSTDTVMQHVYEAYLVERAKDSIREVKAYAVYQLCLYWNKAHIESNKYTPAQVLRLYEENQDLFRDYAYLDRILGALKAEILSGSLRASMEPSAIPGEPLLMHITYKNRDRLRYNIVRLNQEDTLPSGRLNTLGSLLTKPVYREAEVALPLSFDHDVHETSVKIDALPAGRYYLIFSPGHIAKDQSDLGYLVCDVSRMKILSSDGRIDVLDARTGYPLLGVAMKASYTWTDRNKQRHEVVQRGYTNKEGVFMLKEEEKYKVRVVQGVDTLDNEVEATGDDDRDIYDPDLDTPMEYYEDKAKIAVFTDRAIYRPGQTVYYKAILMTRDLSNGRMILFNKANIDKGLFSRRLRHWLQEKERALYIEDPFSRVQDTIHIRPNAFGSFSGSFRIPEHAATGSWSFDPENFDTEFGTGGFRVEEYKRPRFECKVMAPEKTYQPGEPVSFKLQVRTFTGASPGNTTIRYSISRDGVDLADSNAVTDNKGVLTVTVADTKLPRFTSSDSVKWVGYYQLEATAIDVTGESHDVSSSLRVSFQPVRITFGIPTAVAADRWKPVLFTTKDLNDLTLSKELQITVYRVYKTAVGDEKQEEMYAAHLNTGAYEKLDLPVTHWKQGRYRIRARCIEQGRLLGEKIQDWTLFDVHSKEWGLDAPDFFYCLHNYAEPGDTIRWFAGTDADSSYNLMQLKYYSSRYKRVRSVALYKTRYWGPGVHEEYWRIPSDATGEAMLQWVSLRDNIVHRQRERVTIHQTREQSRIIVEQFRDHWTPGEKAEFTVSVRTKDRAVAAELLSTIYDASLDKLEKQEWRLPDERPLESNWTGWNSTWTPENTDQILMELPRYKTGTLTKPLWWLPEGVRLHADLRGEEEILADDLPGLLEGRMAGISFGRSAMGYDNVVVMGYGVATKRFSTGSVITIRGVSTWPAMDKQALIILDGVPYTGELSKIDIRTITDGVLMKGADATNLYGSRAANGVLILSTKGPLNLAGKQEDPPVRIRSNFSETAFFSPALYAGRDGLYHFEFTVPESVTEWVWKIIAHTKKAQFVYEERKFQTRLPLMIQPLMPRFITQGDRVTIRCRISNLDSIPLSGKVSYRIEDATTGEDLSAKLIRSSSSDFTLSGRAVTTATAVLQIPEGQLHPIKLICKASTATYADGEAQIMPVLSSRVLSSRYRSFTIGKSGDTTVTLPPLAAGDSLVGIGLSIDVPPKNALVNALPWLAGYSYDCAEQTFNKMLAECTALGLLRRDTALQRTYHIAELQSKPGDQGSSMTTPDMPAGTTTPWESLAGRTHRQVDDLLKLFDTAAIFQRIEKHLQHLYELQNPDGGLAWFAGGKSNAYMSAYVLAGFGRLRGQQWAFTSSVVKQLDEFVRKLIGYGDQQFIDQPSLWYAYARRYWRDQYPCSARLKDSVGRLIGKEWQTTGDDLRGRALRVILTADWLDRQAPAIQDELRSLYEEAIIDPRDGVRWKSLADDDDLMYGQEETLALLAEAFLYSPKAKEVRTGIVQWLLQHRAEHHWTSTKATAAVIGLLQEAGVDLPGQAGDMTMAAGSETLHVSNGILAGDQLAYTSTGKYPAALTIRKGGDASVTGGLGVYYFGSPKDDSSFVRMEKQLYVYVDSAHAWRQVDEDRVLHVGDRLKTVMVIRTRRPMRFVFLNDQAAATMEPADVESRYEYSQGLSYYRSIRDRGAAFFFDFMPAGKWEISYESKVSHSGSFAGGLASIECMYKPEVHAYAAGIRLGVEH